MQGDGKLSSTNRGYDRHKSDYYITPVSRVQEFLNEFIKHEPDAFNGHVVDPSSGGDQNHPMSYPTAISNLNLNGGGITTIDIREDSLAEIKNNYLSVELPIKPKIIISNPPFNLSEEIIEKSLNDVEDGGFVVMLLRLNFFEGKKRKEGFWRRVGLPKYSFVHHRRMSFTDDGKTDSVAYQHIVFQKGYNPEFTLLKVI